nr:hypothetical protein [Methanosarcina horonobensis]
MSGRKKEGFDLPWLLDAQFFRNLLSPDKAGRTSENGHNGWNSKKITGITGTMASLMAPEALTSLTLTGFYSLIGFMKGCLTELPLLQPGT